MGESYEIEELVHTRLPSVSCSKNGPWLWLCGGLFPSQEVRPAQGMVGGFGTRSISSTTLLDVLKNPWLSS